VPAARLPFVHVLKCTNVALGRTKMHYPGIRPVLRGWDSPAKSSTASCAWDRVGPKSLSASTGRAWRFGGVRVIRCDRGGPVGLILGGCTAIRSIPR
jgi:hypothetical protein